MLSCLSHFQPFATLWAVARQASSVHGFSRKEYWSGLSFPSPGDLPDPGIKPVSLKSPELADWFFSNSTTQKTQVYVYWSFVSHCSISLSLRRGLWKPQICSQLRQKS